MTLPVWLKGMQNGNPKRIYDCMSATDRSVLIAQRNSMKAVKRQRMDEKGSWLKHNRKGKAARRGMIATGFFLLSLLMACGKADSREETATVPEYVFTYAENQAEDYPTTQGGYKFAELVRERTGGKIEILISAGAVLGDEKSVVDQLRFGGIDFTRASISSLGDVLPKMNVLQLPYLYTGQEHMWKVLDGEIGDEFFAEVESLGLVALSWYDAGARNFYTSTKPIEKLEDFQGMKIRVQEAEVMADMVEALGAEAVPMTYTLVYSALQTGEIDGAENNWPSYESMGHYEVAKYYTVDEHTRVPEVQLVSRSTWDQLTPEYQQIIRECAKESAIYERDLWARREKTAMRKVVAKDCQVVELSAEEKQRFRNAVMPLYEKYYLEYMDLIEAIVAVGETE